eukprot:TRINITY_DN9815_c0_g1_i4.p2 TRINITY_DN9815_c0_g1~~TRINITY_DN9815_c0_g1_i4.p2  ORF type:complete len:140 (+),score=11.70 TRINITY_DN9815_c0_g1_i4:916-1335(+)
MKKIKLNLAERFAILAKLPQRGRLQVMATATALRKKLEVTSQDVTDFEVQDIVDEQSGQTTGVKWNPEVDTTREFEISNDAEIAMMVDIVKQMDENEEITATSLDMATEVMSWKADCNENVAKIVNEKDANTPGVEEMQ